MRRITALALAGTVLALLGLAQLILPGIAAQRLRDRLARSGTVLQVEVDAFPAVELLWHQADRVVVRLAQYRSTAGNLGSLLAQLARVGSLDAFAGELDTGLLTLRDVTLRERAGVLTGSAKVTESDLRAALPFLDSVQPVASASGGLTFRGTATLLGVSASLDAMVRVQNGELVVQPQVPILGFPTLTIFANPQIDIQGVGATSDPGGFSLSVHGRLR